jgi:hypothetical protein
METIAIRITKEVFDQAVPAAREPKGIIFGKLQKKIDNRIEDIAEDRLGDTGIIEVNGDPEGRLAMRLMELACVDVFLHEMRNMDLVLTPTGFGVVSTNDTAPASKIRVDALDGELRVKWLMLSDDLLELCFKLEGWYRQGLVIIDTLFCDFKFLKAYAGMQAPLAKDWETASAAILACDRFLREKISDEFMDELIEGMASSSLTTEERGVVHQIRRTIGAAIQGNEQLKDEYFRRLMNTLEQNLDDFPTYMNSEAFEANHFKHYENHAEDSAFHFCG